MQRATEAVTLRARPFMSRGLSLDVSKQMHFSPTERGVFELPDLHLLIWRSRERMVHLVKAVHVQLSHEALPICVLEPGWQDEAREFRRIRHAENIARR